MKYIFEISIKDTPLTAYFVQKSGMMQTGPCAAPLNMLENPLLSTCGSDTLVLHVKQIDGKGDLNLQLKALWADVLHTEVLSSFIEVPYSRA